MYIQTLFIKQINVNRYFSGVGDSNTTQSDGIVLRIMYRQLNKLIQLKITKLRSKIDSHTRHPIRNINLKAIIPSLYQPIRLPNSNDITIARLYYKSKSCDCTSSDVIPLTSSKLNFVSELKPTTFRKRTVSEHRM